MKLAPTVLLLLCATPALAEPLPNGRYTGAATYGGALELRVKGKAATVEVARPGCQGDITGKISATGAKTWRLTSPPNQGDVCRIDITRARDGGLTLGENEGCMFTHGTSCSFDGTVR